LFTLTAVTAPLSLATYSHPPGRIASREGEVKRSRPGTVAMRPSTPTIRTRLLK
jgi:hypothetical protein